MLLKCLCVAQMFMRCSNVYALLKCLCCSNVFDLLKCDNDFRVKKYMYLHHCVKTKSKINQDEFEYFLLSILGMFEKMKRQP